MDELLFRYLRQQTTEDENRSVDAWRSRSADAASILLDLGRLIEAGRAADRMVDPGDPPSVEQVTQRAEASRFRSPTRRSPGRNRFVHYGGWTAAAAVAGVALWNALADSPESVASGSPASQDTPLAAAMREVGERYGTEVEIVDSALLDRTLTMWFSRKSLEEVLTVVCGVIDASCGIGEGVVRIMARGEELES